jgi:hypothetical protein
MSTEQAGPPCELCGSTDHTPDAHFDGRAPWPPSRGIGDPPTDGAAPSYATEPVQIDDDDDDR